MAAALGSRGERAIEHVHAAVRPPSTLGLDDFSTLGSARLLVFEALLCQTSGDQSAAERAWKAAAQTADETNSEEGLFRAISLHKSGEIERAETWFRDFLTANDQNKNSVRATTRSQAYYLSGVYAAFRGESEKARESIRQSIEIDRTFLWAHQALAWLDARLFVNLAR